jgi:hypothetical protein
MRDAIRAGCRARMRLRDTLGLTPGFAALALSVWLASATGCARQHRSPLAGPGTSTTAAVYTAVLSSMLTRRQSDTILVHDSTAVFAPPRPAPASPWRARFDSLPPALVAALASASRPARPTSTLELPRPIRIVTGSELREIFARRREGLWLDSAWMELFRRYPHQRSILSLSPVVFNADSTGAMVYYTYSCGAECGGSNVMWLSHGGGAGSWHVRADVPVGSIF